MVRDQLLVRGQIFLNTSLTEAFCMAIVEVASCGLAVVSTAVERGLVTVIQTVISGDMTDPWAANEFVSRAYNWRNVAARTETVYERVSSEAKPSLGRRLRNLWECGEVAGPLMAMVYLAAHYFILLLNWLRPI